MAYTDFTLENVEGKLGLESQRARLFPGLNARVAPPWLGEVLTRGRTLALVSEKSRGEFIVAPVLLAARELSGDRFAILSGQALDVDADRKLTGECDFVLTLSDPYPLLRAPLVTIVEAKRHDIEAGLGQCIAQMVAAQVFNERSKRPLATIYGCVTTGEDWQFLKLTGAAVTIDQDRFYIDTVGNILGALLATIESVGAPPRL